MSNAERIRDLTTAIEAKCRDDLVDYVAANTYLTAWAVEAVDGSERIPHQHGVIPEGRIIDESTVKLLKVAMGFSHIDQLVECANAAIVREWQRVRPDLELTWRARVFGFTDELDYEAIGIDTLIVLEYPRRGWWNP